MISNNGIKIKKKNSSIDKQVSQSQINYFFNAA